MKCEKCGHELQIGDYPFCSKDGIHLSGSNGVIADSIPGGEIHEHGICHADGTPRKFYSKSEINSALKEKGLSRWVEHKGSRGSDKSPFTTRWY